jgi:hypothetical protein
VDDVARICASLVNGGPRPRAELPELDHPDLRREVESRLEAVGLTLATSAYSDHVGLRLSPRVAPATEFDAASNLDLKADACALLVILWARLVLQKRTASDSHETPGQRQIFAGDEAEEARRYVPRLRQATLVKEFGKVLGSRSRIKGLVTQLRKLGFVAGRGETIEAGPLLELAVDGERMMNFVRRQVIAGILEAKPGAEPMGDDAADDGIEGRALAALREAGGSAGMKRLSEIAGEKQQRLRTALRALIEAGSVRKSGQRGQTLYHIVERPCSGSSS